MAKIFRSKAPIRTCVKKYSNYRSYKPYISRDFNNRCGYTDCPDFWFGGLNTFHIDHFKSFSKNPELETDYSNLVYCCSYVNILKSNDEGDYIDPCNVDFNNHFERTDDGSIFPKPSSKEATYMFHKLKLGLSRYRLIWVLEELLQKLAELQKEINDPRNSGIKNELRIIHSELAEEFTDYLKYLKANQ